MAKAFVILKNFDTNMGGLTATQIRIDYEAAVGDGIAPPRILTGNFFTFDAGLSAASNLAAIKNAVIAHAASFGYTLATTDVSVFTAIN
jgi:hypothetical protein